MIKFLFIFKKVMLLILLGALHFSVFSQFNLVPNPSFEYYDSCPQPIAPNYQGVDKICRAVPWFSPAQPEPFNCGGSSTDFFHACNGSVPRNINGFQYARTGLGYGGAGVATNPSGSNGREYLQVQLIESLKKKNTVFHFMLLQKI